MKRILLALAVVAMLEGCKTRERVVTVETTRTDTAYISRIERDSIYIETLRHDSVLVRDKGDTLLIEHWHTDYRDRWRDKIVRDTVYQARVDSVFRNNVITEYRDRPLTWWQRTRIYIGGVAIWLALIAAGVWAWKKSAHKIQ